MGFDFIKKLPTPEEIRNQYPIDAEIQAVKDARDKELRDVFTGKSDKFLAIIGPCSADNEDAVLDYLTRLRNVQEKIADKVLIVPRVYTNKPRTTGEGYKGMVHQPDPEKQPNLLAGLVAIRKMHIHAIRTSGMTCADEMLYPENYRYLSDLLSYVAIGKTKKQVKRVYQELLAKGCMSYTIILAAFNDDTPPVLYLTPYVAASIAEKFMMEGNDVLLVLDDLKRHADVHREISLLLGHVPGREAYPPDIFYTHSRLLERGCQHLNGGSITILPIVETKGGDITGYISTNIISITDGQIVLSKKNFDKGQKPAINYGLSVSRLGGAVQEEKVKKLGTKVRRELLSYLETREVYELANMDEMSPLMRAKLKRGAKILEGLIQYKYSPQSPETCISKFSAILQEGAAEGNEHS